MSIHDLPNLMPLQAKTDDILSDVGLAVHHDSTHGHGQVGSAPAIHIE